MRSRFAKITRSDTNRLFKAGVKDGVSAGYMEAEVEARRAKRGERPGDFGLLADWRHHKGPSQ